MILWKRLAAALLLIACTLAPSQGSCADETALFNSIQPDVLILLDLSGSMKRNPAGIFQIYGNEDCSIVDGMGFTDCRRYIIAKRAVFNLLDDNRDGKIDGAIARPGTAIGVERDAWAGSNRCSRRRPAAMWARAC